MDHFQGHVLESKEAQDLKVISRWGVGYDAIDVPAATDKASWWLTRPAC